MASNRTILTCAHRGIRLIMHSWGHNLCAMTRYMPWVFSSRDPGAIRDNQVANPQEMFPLRYIWLFMKNLLGWLVDYVMFRNNWRLFYASGMILCLNVELRCTVYAVSMRWVWFVSGPVMLRLFYLEVRSPQKTGFLYTFEFDSSVWLRENTACDIRCINSSHDYYLRVKSTRVLPV